MAQAIEDGCEQAHPDDPMDGRFLLDINIVVALFAKDATV
jgi:hypothetical protein